MGTGRYRMKPGQGKHTRTEKGTRVTYKAGDVVELTDAEYATHSSRFEPVGTALGYGQGQDRAVQVGGAQAPNAKPAAPEPASAAHPIHDLTVPDARDMVAKARTAEDVNALEAAELANPKHEGGRQGVLSAVEQRRAALEA